ncbi:MAG: DPP IV N-terminal domain-containing protein [Bacteroidales bacterium]|nr:DPP IV N-terminal domain-containing protein [Bacteroidales bacterium]
MKKFYWLLLITYFVSTYIYAQQKLLTIDEAVLGLYRTMYAEQLYHIQWRNISTFTYVKGDQLYQQTINKSEEQKLLHAQQLFEISKDSIFSNIRMFPAYEWTSNNTLWIKHNHAFLELDIQKNSIISKIVCPDSAENFDLNTKNKYVAFTIQNSLYIQTTNGEQYCIGKDDDKGIVYGKSVHRNEFGINKGTFWSNTGRYLAFYRMDERMVTEYPLVNIQHRIATVAPIRYPMAGMKSHEVTIGIYDTQTKQTIYLKTGEPKEQYLTNISWSFDDEYILVAILNREQNYMKLNIYNPNTGEFVKTLYEEKNDRYVEPLNPAVFISKHQFIWQSQKDGFNHLYIYDLTNHKMKQISKGSWVITSYLGIDSKKQWIFAEAAYPTALERRILKFNISSTTMNELTTLSGTHQAIFNPDFTHFIDLYQNLDAPTGYYLYNLEGKPLRKIHELPNVLKDYKPVNIEMITIKSADGKTDLYGRVVKPADFDPKKKYPLILYVYGGPHAQLVQNEWLGGATLWDYYMAQRGYVIATVDNRGSANRGFEFESCIHRQLGINEAKDQMEFVKFLIKQGYIDENRIGVHGWSYGGFMTLTLMTTYPEIFKVGVAGGPVIDWKYYEIMYGERYMDTPQENSEGYENSSLLNKVKQLKGKTLIIHGYLDDTVVLQHSLTFIEKCIKNGILVDYFIYPTHAHNVRGKDRIHLMKKVTQYFDDYLK